MYEENDDGNDNIFNDSLRSLGHAGDDDDGNDEE
jgi:hypothetical protein